MSIKESKEKKKFHESSAKKVYTKPKAVKKRRIEYSIDNKNDVLRTRNPSIADLIGSYGITHHRIDGETKSFSLSRIKAKRDLVKKLKLSNDKEE